MKKRRNKKASYFIHFQNHSIPAYHPFLQSFRIYPYYKQFSMGNITGMRTERDFQITVVQQINKRIKCAIDFFALHLLTL